MANDCCGTMKIVAKNKETIERLFKIMDYDDEEYCLYRCRDVQECDEPFEEDGYWVSHFNIDGAWSCEAFLNYGDRPTQHLKGYAKKEDGTLDYNKEVEKSAHFTDLSHLAKVLDFGCEFWTEEPGCCFAEHGIVNHDGHYEYETEHYEIKYPLDANGEEDYDAEPEEECGFGDEWKEWMCDDEIYGNEDCEDDEE